MVHSGKVCNGCNKKKIVGTLFKCLSCKDIHLCEACYKGFSHPNHKYFLKKTKAKDQWTGGGIRSTKNTLTNVMLHENMEFASYLFHALPNCMEQDINIGKGIVGLEIVGFEAKSLVCNACHAKKGDASKVKKLPCGHKICDECVYSYLKAEIYRCPIENASMFAGFETKGDLDKTLK